MEILKQLRQQNGFSQKEVAKQLSVTTQCYQRYEVGDRQPTPEMLCKLADVFEVSVDYLIGRETAQNKNTALLNSITHPEIKRRCEKQIKYKNN